MEKEKRKITDKELNRVRVVSRNADNHEFIKSFERILKNRELCDKLYSLDYVVEDGVKWLYVTYTDGVQKRLRLTSESGIGIMREFALQIDTAEIVRDVIEEFLPPNSLVTV